MINLTTLPKSFWGYALVSVIRILNMVPTKKVERTPYEIWHGKAPKLSYLRVWGCEALMKRDTPDTLDSRSIKCIFFFENNLMVQEASGSYGPIESSGSDECFVEYGVSTSTGYGVSSSLSNTAYSSQQINTAMTKVIKGEFEKIKDIKVEDDSLACDSPLEVFNCEVSRLSKMDDDLFTYEVEIANIPCDLRVDDDSEHEADDMGFDPSDIAFTEWLGSKFFNYKTMDHYTMKALWIYWIRGDDEVELTDEEFSDNEDEIAEVFRIDTNIFDYETPICSAFNKFNYLSKVGNLPGTFIIENQLHYQDYEWYKALEDSELKDEALRNKAIIEGFIKDDDDESSYEQMRRWDIHTNYDDTYKTNHDDNEREELCEVHEPLDLVKEISTNIGEEFTNLEILKCWSLETSRGVQHKIR
ncbi:hypothetical protein Tco_1227994 [Tanacetum coccineum]